MQKHKRRRVIQAESSSSDGQSKGSSANDGEEVGTKSSSSEDEDNEKESTSNSSEEISESTSSGSSEDASSSEGVTGQGNSSAEEDEELDSKGRVPKNRISQSELLSRVTSKSTVQEYERVDLQFPLGKPFEPKPMVELKAGSNIWYQAYVVKESANEVKLQVPGVNGSRKPLVQWIHKGSSRIWRGSLRTDHWKHLGRGTWEPKATGTGSGKRTRGYGRGHAGSSGRRPHQPNRSQQRSGASMGCSTDQNSKPPDDEVMSPRPQATKSDRQPFKSNRPHEAMAASTDITGSMDEGDIGSGDPRSKETATGPQRNGRQAAVTSGQRQGDRDEQRQTALEVHEMSEADHASTQSPHVAESPAMLGDQNSARAHSSRDDEGLGAHHHRHLGAHVGAGMAAALHGHVHRGHSVSSQGNQPSDPLTRWFMRHMATLAAAGMLSVVPEGSLEAGALPPGFTYDPTTRKIVPPHGQHTHGDEQQQPSAGLPHPFLGVAGGGTAGKHSQAGPTASTTQSRPAAPEIKQEPRQQDLSSERQLVASMSGTSGNQHGTDNKQPAVNARSTYQPVPKADSNKHVMPGTPPAVPVIQQESKHGKPVAGLQGGAPQTAGGLEPKQAGGAPAPIKQRLASKLKPKESSKPQPASEPSPPPVQVSQKQSSEQLKPGHTGAVKRPPTASTSNSPKPEVNAIAAMKKQGKQLHAAGSDVTPAGAGGSQKAATKKEVAAGQKGSATGGTTLESSPESTSHASKPTSKPARPASEQRGTEQAPEARKTKGSQDQQQQEPESGERHHRDPKAGKVRPHGDQSHRHPSNGGASSQEEGQLDKTGKHRSQEQGGSGKVSTEHRQTNHEHTQQQTPVGNAAASVAVAVAVQGQNKPAEDAHQRDVGDMRTRDQIDQHHKPSGAQTSHGDSQADMARSNGKTKSTHRRGSTQDVTDKSVKSSRRAVIMADDSEEEEAPAADQMHVS